MRGAGLDAGSLLRRWLQNSRPASGNENGDEKEADSGNIQETELK